MDVNLKDQLLLMKFKENRYGGVEGSVKGFHFTVTENPFNLVVIYSFISKREIMVPTEFPLPKNADLQMICKCIIGIIEGKDSIEIYNDLDLLN